MNFKTLEDLDVDGKTVLLRPDLNVPMKNNTVTDTMRIDRLKPTIDYLLKHNAKIVLVAHYGRPNGQRVFNMSMGFIAPVLQTRWNVPVSFSPDTIGKHVKESIAQLPPKSIVLLENVRFHKEENENDDAFARKLADLADVYVNDGFSNSHRAHASMLGVTKYLPSAAGLLLQQEIKALDSALDNPEKPLLAIVGGAKISTKLGVLKSLIEKVDYLVLGGGMANTFLYAKGVSMGKSLCEKDMIDKAREIMKKAEEIGCEIILPIDVVVAGELKENTYSDIVDVEDIPPNTLAVDIGPKSISFIKSRINKTKTVIWNGPLGVFEVKPFDNGTNVIANAVANRTQKGNCSSIAGGGDTIAALENANCQADFSYISTAGGAFLEWLEDKELPAIVPLLKNAKICKVA
ncbi:MAG: phosphoglycerate kinase [Alphaproteobacteria bacterium]|nr:phosphoglycerate kinase [Alphaproteobacteria bacterium]